MKRLLEVSKFLNLPRNLRMKVPKFFIDNLINTSLHKIISTQELSSTSLAGAVCFFLCSLRKQNIANPEEVDDTHYEDYSSAFFLDMLFHHPGYCHKAIAVALNLMKIVIQMGPSRVVTSYENILSWIAYHGSWHGSMKYRAYLIAEIKRKLHLEEVPHPQPQLELQQLFTVLSDPEASPNLLFWNRTLLSVLFNWLCPKTLNGNLLISTIKTVRHHENFNVQFLLKQLGKLSFIVTVNS